MLKKIITAYTSFNRTERMGIVALLILLLVLVAIRATMQYWVAPVDDAQKQQELVASWEAFKAKETKAVPQKQENTNTPSVKTDQPKHHSETKPEQVTKHVTETATLFPFDPNTIDSAGLRKLGLREKTTSIFLHWRAKGKKFYKKEELKKLYTLTEEEYNKLEPYITIDRSKLK